MSTAPKLELDRELSILRTVPFFAMNLPVPFTK
jgi:hypothetical protein